MFLTKISAAKTPIIIPLNDKSDSFVTFNDLKDLKLAFLTFAVVSLINLIKILYSFFSKDRLNMKEKVDYLEKNSTEISHKIDKLLLTVAQIKDSQITQDEIRLITRNEIDYRDRIKSSS